MTTVYPGRLRTPVIQKPWFAIHLEHGQTVAEFAASLNRLVESGAGEKQIPWEALGGLCSEPSVHLPLQDFTPADSRSQPAPTTRALPTQDPAPDDLG